MMDRNAAMEALRFEGFHAFERDWSLGESIGVAALPIPAGDITLYRVILYLYPFANDGWNVAITSGSPEPCDEHECRSLEEAVALAIQLMRGLIAAATRRDRSLEVEFPQ